MRAGQYTRKHFAGQGEGRRGNNDSDYCIDTFEEIQNVEMRERDWCISD